MIYTVTLNPAIDETIGVARLEVNGVSEAETLSRQAAGKGINVSRALKTLGRESVPVVLLGNRDIPFFREEMAAAGLPWVSFSYDGEVRTSQTLVFGENGFNTHIRKPGSLPAGYDPQPLFRYLLEKAEKNDYVVFSGGLPAGLAKETYGELIRTLNGKGVLTILDTHGEALAAGIAAAPFCLKINMDEFIDFAGEPEEDTRDFKGTLAALHAGGISLVVITMGREGAMLHDGEQFLFVRTRDKIKELEQRYALGCGDVFLAALVNGFEEKLSLEECLKEAVATAAANTLLPGAARFNPRDRQRFLAVMEVKREL